MKPQSAHQTVTALESMGYIDRQPDEFNRRILRINLTAKGRGLLESCNRAVDQLEMQMFQDLHGTETLELQQLLIHCLRNLAPPL